MDNTTWTRRVVGGAMVGCGQVTARWLKKGWGARRGANRQADTLFDLWLACTGMHSGLSAGRNRCVLCRGRADALPGASLMVAHAPLLALASHPPAPG